MSFRRVAGLGSVLACMLVMPASALAATSVTITAAQLGPEGGQVTVAAQYSCDDLYAAYLNVDVSQANGNRLVRAFGQTSSYYGGLVCDGAIHTAQVLAVNGGNIPFKKGKATVVANLQQQYYLPASTIVTQTVSLK